jgi:hypothetical protein
MPERPPDAFNDADISTSQSSTMNNANIGYDSTNTYILFDVG